MLIGDVNRRWQGDRAGQRYRAAASPLLMAAPFDSGILATGAKPGATFLDVEAAPGIVERTRRIEAVGARHGLAIAAGAPVPAA